MIRKIYRSPEVCTLFGFSPSTLKRKVKDGEIQPPISLGLNMVGWPEEYLEEYRAKLIAKSEAEFAEAS